MVPANSAPQATRTWLLEHICPYWHARIVDPNGGFFESLDRNGQANASPARTVLNQARLTYVFSHASVLSGDEKMRNAADHGFDFLRRASVLTGSFEGWHRSTNIEGEILDPARDTYDHAFVIFAMAWYHRASASREAVQIAEQAYEILESYLADPVNGGFFEEFPFIDKLPRRQNPHMHLLEAVLAMHAATGAEEWLGRATKLVTLFKSVFLDRKTGTLAEYFNRHWGIADDPAGVLREPGHQFEWVWLLGQYTRQAQGPDLGAVIVRLFEFGARHGIDSSGPLRGIVFDSVNADGEVVADSKLFWPQTEYIKACIARFEATRDVAYRQRAFAHLSQLRAHFFHEDGANWVNHLTRDGEPLVSETPSRVLYHLFLAFAELIRIEEA